MAQTPSVRVNALERSIDAHIFRLDVIEGEVATIQTALSGANKELAELMRESGLEIALLKREAAELRKAQDEFKRQNEEWGRKLWMILPPVLAVFISNALTLLISLYLRK